DHVCLWRGSLLPLDCAAVAKPSDAVCLTEFGCSYWGRFAARREQAPSPQIASSLRLTVANPRPTSEAGAICMLIGKDRSHGSIVRSWRPEQTCPISAATAFATRTPP